MPNPQIRTVTRNRSRRRRFTACHRHPSESVTGFCALCLRDRLAGLDSDSGQVEAEKVVVCSRRTRGHGAVLELRRSKSVAGGKCAAVNDLDSDCRRKSCDVRARNSLSDLFVVDDVRSDSMNLGFLTLPEPVVETKEEEDDVGGEIRLSDDEIRISRVLGDDDKIRVSDDGEIEEGDLKTMKEIIEMELNNKRRNFWDAASVFSQKLRKWRQKQKEKKQSRCINGESDNNRSKLGQFSQFRDNQSEVEDNRFGRRSCDTEPRFSIDGHRLSVEDPRFSFDEHRASWDGYMIARTIPRLTPMLSVVDNMMLGQVNRRTTMSTTTMENLQMHSISEDGASSGGSGQSISDSFTSIRGSSSSFSTKTVGLGGGDDVKSASNARVSPANDVVFQGTKLVITEKELKDWHLNSVKNSNIESISNMSNSTGKTTVTNEHKIVISRWKKVCSLWGHKHKVDDKNGEKKDVEDTPEKRVETGISSMSFVRNQSLVNSRNRSTRYSTSDLDSGLLRLYLTPFRNSKRNKSGKKQGSINGQQLN